MPIAIHHHTGHAPHPREPDGIVPCYKTQEVLMSSEELGELPYVKAPICFFSTNTTSWLGINGGPGTTMNRPPTGRCFITTPWQR